MPVPIKRHPGRPVTTGMTATPAIHYRVSAEQHAELEAEGRRRRPRLSPSQVAKLRAFGLVP